MVLGPEDPMELPSPPAFVAKDGVLVGRDVVIDSSTTTHDQATRVDEIPSFSCPDVIFLHALS